MTRARVVALAAALQLLCITAPAVAMTRMPSLPSVPGTGHLLDPMAARHVPRFVDPLTLSRAARIALTAPRKMGSKHPVLASAPRLPRRTRRVLLRRVAHVLPHYGLIFRRVAQDYRLPASLLAAQSYIESRWRPGARYRGAAGMMMLTRQAAHIVGVHNRLSPAQSIRGGARYLDQLRAEISPSVPYPDRDMFALAAYNMGLAHLQDARLLARRLGLDPNLWSNLREVLPLLAKRRYYTTLPHGYARGSLVVRYVDRILRYQAVIAPHLR